MQSSFGYVVVGTDESFPLRFTNSSVIATNLLSVDEILRAGRSSLKNEGPGMGQ